MKEAMDPVRIQSGFQVPAPLEMLSDTKACWLNPDGKSCLG